MDSDRNQHLGGPPKPLRLILFSQPRTGSNCWMRLFEKHPQLCTSQYFLFHSNFHGPERFYHSGGIHAKELYDIHEQNTCQKGFEKMLAFIKDAEGKNKIPFVKDHTFALLKNEVVAETIPNSKRAGMPDPVIREDEANPHNISWSNPAVKNPFILPDSFVASIAPVILIRHPARTIPSIYRNCKAVYEWETSQEGFKVFSPRWSRVVYDFWAEYFKASGGTEGGTWPLVIDFDEVVRDEQAVVRRFCEKVGIDESAVAYKWDAISDEDFENQTFLRKLTLGKVQKSTDIIRDESTLEEPDVDEEEQRWRELYGADVARNLRDLIDQAMEDYNYLRARCV